jgi:hypothetical protein
MASALGGNASQTTVPPTPLPPFNLMTPATIYYLVSEAARWKRQFFARKREWDALDEGSSLIGRVGVCARWGATQLFRELVLRTTADVNRLYGGRSMLHVASSCGSLELVKVLVAELKADPNATSGARIDQDPSSRVSTAILNYHTCLSFAVQSGSEETVRWLLEHGARVELDVCLGCIIVASAEGHTNLAQLFLEKLASSKPSEGWVAGLFGQAAGHATMEDALLVAVEKASQHAPAVAALLQHGVPATKGAGDWAPIHEAAIRGNMDVIKLLIQHGADAGNTPPCPIP